MSVIFTVVYLLFVGFFFANELYVRLYDRGNSEMAGLVTYFLTLPSSWLIDSVSKSLFGMDVGSSDTSFIFILGSSAVLNATIILLILRILSLIWRGANENQFSLL
jgi:hypothetical protein